MIFKLVRPIGQEQRPFFHHPDLIKSLIPYLEKRGHSVTGLVQDANVILFDSEVWDRSDNDPLLPKRSYSPYNPEDLQAIIESKLPIVFFDNFDHRGTPTHFAAWPGKNNWEDCKYQQDWGRFMYEAKDHCKIVYFKRKMQKSFSYPDWVYPLEYPLFNDYPLTTKEELFNRPNDVCFLGETGWIRENTIKCIKADGRLKADLEHVDCTKRTTLDEWIDRHRKAKMFLEVDNSMGSERPMRLMTVAPMLRVKSDHKIPFLREDMAHYIEIGDYDGTVTPDDIDKVLSVVQNEDKLYSIYTAGAEHMRAFYSFEARSDYVISIIERTLCK